MLTWHCFIISCYPHLHYTFHHHTTTVLYYHLPLILYRHSAASHEILVRYCTISTNFYNSEFYDDHFIESELVFVCIVSMHTTTFICRNYTIADLMSSERFRESCEIISKMKSFEDSSFVFLLHHYLSSYQIKLLNVIHKKS